ncbi:hypothetical protein VPH35_104914 [Triticum aestivum]
MREVRVGSDCRERRRSLEATDDFFRVVGDLQPTGNVCSSSRRPAAAPSYLPWTSSSETPSSPTTATTTPRTRGRLIHLSNSFHRSHLLRPPTRPER